MRQRLGIILIIVLVIGALVVINSLAFVSEEDKPDSEATPNRSTYNARSTGTRALHDFLNESGYQVMRWREPTERLLGSSGEKVQTFVIIGRTRLSIEDEEAKELLRWVAKGGRLVVIDRTPDLSLLPQSGKWKVTTDLLRFPGSSVDANQPAEMIGDVDPVSPAQPTIFTQRIETVMPSKFCSAISIAAVNQNEKAGATPTPKTEPGFFDDDEGPPPPAPLTTNASGNSPAPVIHLTTAHAPLLVDYQYGNGRITLLSDPFIVANNGISYKDNLQLALNILSPRTGLIAFDEFHQGYGATHNAFVGYFDGTPVLAICGQIIFVILLILWTRGRRFARPLPLPRVDRRSSLEFVASMAELQQRARAYDLALENIYSRTRRVLTRYAGVDYNSSRTVIADRIAARSSLEAHKIEALMRQTEDAINGGQISERQSIQLVKRMREVESALGLRMRRRQVKQSVENT
ncbi:MAG TPA: DUF4350 domain-containing protein [Pyrinomonadaceae bacterium]|nr:DUF4350 domain-containing protein [Pyrinomonadaceae bacterium]